MKWIIAILLVILVLGTGYYAYMKYFKKGGGAPGTTKDQPKGPSRPAYSLTKQRVPVSRPNIRASRSETKIEKELDEALGKAKKLIKK